jgi:hypothetical protein
VTPETTSYDVNQQHIRPRLRHLGQSVQARTSTYSTASSDAQGFASYPLLSSTSYNDNTFHERESASTITAPGSINDRSPLLREDIWLFNILNNTPQHIIAKERNKGWWCVLSGTSLPIYKSIYNSCKDRKDGLVSCKQSLPSCLTLASWYDFALRCKIAYRLTDDRYRSLIPLEAATDDRVQELWQALHRSPNSPVTDIRHRKPIVLAITFMLHVERFHPKAQGHWPIDDQQQANIDRFDTWVACGCSPACPRQWNFANNIGLSRTTNEAVEREECGLFRVQDMRSPQKNKVFSRTWQRWLSTSPG